MLNKRHLHHQYVRLRTFKPWYFLAIASVLFTIGVIGLRHNSLEVIRLREAVYKADEQNGDVEKALRELREYVYGHMNTNLSSGNVSIKPPIQLKYRYERLADAESKRVKELNFQVQKQAESTCAQQFPAGGFNSARVSCVTDYVKDHAVKEGDIPTELYKFDFVSPKWAFDLAGVSLLGAAIFTSLFIIRIAVGLWYKHEL